MWLGLRSRVLVLFLAVPSWRPLPPFLRRKGQDPRTAGYVESYIKPLGISSMLDVVIRFAGRHLGLLCLEHVGKAHRWENDEISFARQLVTAHTARANAHTLPCRRHAPR